MSIVDRIAECLLCQTDEDPQECPYFEMMPLVQAVEEVEWSSDEEYQSDEESSDSKASSRAVSVESDEIEKTIKEKCGSETASPDDYDSIVHKLGFAPTRAQARKFKEEHPTGADKKEITKYCNTLKDPLDKPEEMAEIFKYYDPEQTNSVSRKQFMFICTNNGGEEALTPEETARLLSIAGEKGDDVNYMNVIHKALDG